MHFTNNNINILIGMANGFNIDLSLSRKYEIRSDFPRLTVYKIDYSYASILRVIFVILMPYERNF